MSDKYLSSESYHQKYSKLIAELRAVTPDRSKWFKTKRGFPDWSFREVVEFAGFDVAVYKARFYRNTDKYRTCRLAATSRAILAALDTLE